MFNIFKSGRNKNPTEADFDILTEVKEKDIHITYDEMINIFLVWSQNRWKPRSERLDLGSLKDEIATECAYFRKHQDALPYIKREEHLNKMAWYLLENLNKTGLIKEEGPGCRAYFLTDKGERVRQYYVCIKGWQKTEYDRSDRFEGQFEDQSPDPSA